MVVMTVEKIQIWIMMELNPQRIIKQIQILYFRHLQDHRLLHFETEMVVTDATEDLDDDGDGVLDVDDACPISTRITIDHDSDGCMDEYDLDDDNEGS